MQIAHLPEKKANDEVNTVEILNRKRDPKNAEGIKFNIPAEQFEYQVAETIEEIKQLCGGEAEMLKVFNDHLRDDSVNEGKNYIRMATNGTPEEIIAAGLAKSRAFTFIESAKVSLKDRAEAYDSLKNLITSGQTLSDAELAAAARKMLGL